MVTPTMAMEDRETDAPKDAADVADADARQPQPPPTPRPNDLMERPACLQAWQFVGLMVALATLIVLIAIAVLGHSHYNLLIESGATTVISAVNLLVAACLAWFIFGSRREGETDCKECPDFDLRSPAAFWALLAAGLLFLAVDEVLFIHERIDWFIHSLLGMEETELSDSLDDAVVVAYACLGLACLWHYRAELRRYADLKLPVAAGLALATLMVLLDLLTTQRPGLGGLDHVWWMTAEEMCKLAAQWVLLGVLWKVREIVTGRVD